MVRIDENTLRKIIRTALLEAIDEKGTNMQSLYHFTNVEALKKIYSTGNFKLAKNQKDMRNGKCYMSFTRHKSPLEGFASADFDCDVRIEVDGVALSNVRGGDVRPFEYYNPYGSQNWHEYPSAKTAYRMSPMDLGRQFEYMNQAEESFEMDVTTIPIEKLIKRVDILYYDYGGEEGYDDVSEEYNYKAVSSLVKTGSPFVDVTYIYRDWRQFALQTDKCVSAKEFVSSYNAKQAAEE